MHVIGLDIGTTGCKACVFDSDGTIKGYGFREYDIICDDHGMAEQDADRVWYLTREVLKEAVAAAGATSIRALGLSVQGDAIIPVSEQLVPLHNAILGMDYRSAPQAEECARRFGERALYECTGMRPHPMNSLVKMLWLRENAPDVWGRTWKVMTYADFITAKLCGEAVIDFTMASRTMAFDLAQRTWATDLLGDLDIPLDRLSTPRPSGQVVGTMSTQLTEELGLHSDIAVVTGGHDQTCAALGSGAITDRRAVISTGTAEVLSAAFAERPAGDSMYEGYYPCYLHAARDLFFTFSLNHAGGILFRWYRDTLGLPEVEKANAAGTDPYTAIIAAMPPGPSPVMVLPHFNGSGTPTCDLQSRGAIVGLSLSTSRHDIAKAILEALCFELRVNGERLRAAGLRHDEFVAVGGGAHSEAWLQMKADILGCPIRTLAVREAACLGAGLLAATAAGMYESIAEGVERTVKTTRVLEPDDARHAQYNRRFEGYQSLYPSLKPVHAALQQTGAANGD
ncbi:MAG: hypothetical protein GF331_08825 [Chitinivibrionales bacterium]|nr:hypothetical protein [Chitinivibrionales bacterium]